MNKTTSVFTILTSKFSELLKKDDSPLIAKSFGFFEIIENLKLLNKRFDKFGPEPFSSKFNSNYISSFLKNKQKNIKSFLLDQNFVSGIGNIYASEILNQSKINPLKSSGKITKNEIRKIIFYTKKVLNYSIKRGGTTINNFLSIKGVKGTYQKEFNAYNRENQKCKNKHQKSQTFNN